MRKTEFANGEYYHIYNRGVDKREVFLDEKDYVRFLVGVKEFNRIDVSGSLYENNFRERKALLEAKPPIGGLASKSASENVSKLVEIICYCLNSNHYHLILKQSQNDGIAKFMQKIGTAYTMYFNAKNSRSGSLFQGPFKSIHIDSNEYLLLLSAYVNANHEIHNYPEKEWAYSSYLDYVGKRKGQLCEKEIILGQFENNFSEYEKYMQDNMLYFKDKKEKCILE